MSHMAVCGSESVYMRTCSYVSCEDAKTFLMAIPRVHCQTRVGLFV